MESKGERESVRPVARGTRPDREAPCPSLVDVACLESGDLSEARRVAVNAHSRGCFRCGLSLAEFRQARNEILGATARARAARSRRAAEDIQKLLRQRLH